MSPTWSDKRLAMQNVVASETSLASQMMMFASPPDTRSPEAMYFPDGDTANAVTFPS